MAACDGHTVKAPQARTATSTSNPSSSSDASSNTSFPRASTASDALDGSIPVGAATSTGSAPYCARNPSFRPPSGQPGNPRLQLQHLAPKPWLPHQASPLRPSVLRGDVRTATWRSSTPVRGVRDSLLRSRSDDPLVNRPDAMSSTAELPLALRRPGLKGSRVACRGREGEIEARNEHSGDRMPISDRVGCGKSIPLKRGANPCGNQAASLSAERRSTVQAPHHAAATFNPGM